MVKNVRNCINEILKISKFVGLYPYIINSNDILNISKPWLIWVFIVQSGMSTLSSFIIKEPPNYFVQIDVFTTLLTTQRIVFFQLALVVHFLWMTYCKLELTKSFSLLINLEDELSISTTVRKWKALLSLVILFCILGLKTTLIEFSFYELFVLFLTHYQCVLIFSEMFTFSDLLFLYCKYYKQLEKFIQKSPLSRYKLERALNIADQLINGCNEINYCYGPFLFISLISYFFFIMTNLYVIYSLWECKTVLVTVVSILRAILFLFTLHSLLHSCTATSQAVEHFYHSVNRVIFEDKQGLLIQPKDNKLCLNLILRRNLEFTAFGYFNLSNRLFCSMVATTIAYLIIFIQFKNVGNNTFISTCNVSSSRW